MWLVLKTVTKRISYYAKNIWEREIWKQESLITFLPLAYLSHTSWRRYITHPPLIMAPPQIQGGLCLTTLVAPFVATVLGILFLGVLVLTAIYLLEHLTPPPPNNFLVFPFFLVEHFLLWGVSESQGAVGEGSNLISALGRVSATYIK